MSDQSFNLDKAKTLSEALPYMRKYAGQTIVVKYGGHAMGNDDLAAVFARDIVLMKQVGINPVVVHGGGPQIAKMLKRLNIESEFIDGLRVTTKEMVDIVEMVLSGSINKQIVTAINEAGGMALGFSGKDGKLIQAEKVRRTKRDPDSNIEKVLDLGLVGEPKTINPHVIDFFHQTEIIPVIAPIGVGPEGETLNINADTVAGAIAGAMEARRLLMLTDVEGVMDSGGNLISELTIADAEKSITDGTITGGMIPKIKTCVDALQKGVRGAVIIDGRVPHAIILEAFTEHGAGTLIRP